MYLHLGQDIIVKKTDIVGIFDLDNTTTAKSTRELLRFYEKNGLLINVSEDLPKSFVVVVNKSKKNLVYISQMSSKTLLQRLELNI